jgi:hypothetical protein
MAVRVAMSRARSSRFSLSMFASVNQKAGYYGLVPPRYNVCRPAFHRPLDVQAGVDQCFRDLRIAACGIVQGVPPPVTSSRHLLADQRQRLLVCLLNAL